MNVPLIHPADKAADDLENAVRRYLGVMIALDQFGLDPDVMNALCTNQPVTLAVTISDQQCAIGLYGRPDLAHRKIGERSAPSPVLPAN